LEIREEIAEKKRNEQFNRDKPIVPTQIWREKRIAAEENITVDETLADDRVADVDVDLDPQKTWQECTIEEINKIMDDTSDEGSKNNDDVLTDMEVNMVFALPAEFHAPEVEVAELVLGPKNATFEKPEKPEQHLKSLFIRGHIDGKPIGRMLVDGGAGVNIMPFWSFVN
jgi:hypothetical protein